MGTRSKPELRQAAGGGYGKRPPKPAWNWWNPAARELVVQWRTRPVVFDYDQDGINDLILVDHEGYLSFFRRVRKNGELVTLPGKRIFRDENGEELKLSEGEAGRSGRRKIDLVDWDGDNDPDLLINSPRTSPAETRNIAYYENISHSPEETRFRYRGDITPHQLEGHTTSPTTSDWDRDGVPDLLVGAEDGYLYYYPRNEMEN